jgi:hypothetical protein
MKCKHSYTVGMLSVMSLLSTNVDYSFEITLGKIICSLFATVLEAILYITLHRLIGQNCPSLTGFSTLGISTMHMLFIREDHPPPPTHATTQHTHPRYISPNAAEKMSSSWTFKAQSWSPPFIYKQASWLLVSLFWCCTIVISFIINSFRIQSPELSKGLFAFSIYHHMIIIR